MRCTNRRCLVGGRDVVLRANLVLVAILVKTILRAILKMAECYVPRFANWRSWRDSAQSVGSLKGCASMPWPLLQCHLRFGASECGK